MRWMKHLTTASDDEAMAALIDEFGPAGYGVFWIILEKIALQMDETDRCETRYSIKKWSSFAQISSKKFQNIVEFLSNPENFPSKNPIFSTKKDGNFLAIGCRKLLKYRDEYSRKKSQKSGQTPDKLRTLSGQTPEQETDTETETDITTSFPNGKESANADLPTAPPPAHPPKPTRPDKARTKAPPCPHLEIVAAYNEILGGIGMPMVKPKLWKGTRRQHLAARWREDHERQNIAWWRGYFETVRGSPFLTGQNNRGWRADIGWLVKPGNMAKVLEGAYRQNAVAMEGVMPQPRTMNDIRTLQLDAMATYLLEEREREKERENGGQSDPSAGDESRCLLDPPVSGDEVLATATEAHCPGVPRRPR